MLPLHDFGKDHGGQGVPLSDCRLGRGRAHEGLISILSPLARTLIGKNVGDTVTAQLPGGRKTFEIIKANFSKSE